MQFSCNQNIALEQLQNPSLSLLRQSEVRLYLQHSPSGANQHCQIEIASDHSLAGRSWLLSPCEQKGEKGCSGGACTPAILSCQLAHPVPLPAGTSESNPMTCMCAADPGNRDLPLADFGTGEILPHEAFELSNQKAWVGRYCLSDAGKALPESLFGTHSDWLQLTHQLQTCTGEIGLAGELFVQWG